MSKDKVKDLPKNTSRQNVSYNKLSRQFVNHDDQTQIRTVHDNSFSISIDNHESPITDFLQETNIIRSVIDKIDEFSQQIKRIHTEILQLPTNSKLTQELDDKNEEIKKLAYDTSTRLKKMEQTLENHDETNAQRRIKESQIFVLTRRFRDIMIQYNQETVSHRERCKKAIVRELEMVGQRRTNDELEDMLENDFPGSINFSILIDTQKAKQSLNDVEARHRDIVKLENCIKELHNMYRDLATLVIDQGEMIDCIEYNVKQAMDHVQVAKEDVYKADYYRKKVAKKKITILIIVITCVCFIAIALIIGYFTQKKIRGR